jgi:hypothetical protein
LKRVDPSTLHAENAAVASQVVNAAGMTLLVLEADERSSQTVHSGLDAQLYTNRLVIPNAAQRHDGVYICVVTNPAGHIAYRAAHLTVLEGWEKVHSYGVFYAICFVMEDTDTLPHKRICTLSRDETDLLPEKPLPKNRLVIGFEISQNFSALKFVMNGSHII